MKIVAYLIIYFSLFLLSFLMLTGIVREFEQKYPLLVNRKWKRMLWLISCLLFIPLFIVWVKLPFFILDEIKTFLGGRNDK